MFVFRHTFPSSNGPVSLGDTVPFSIPRDPVAAAVFAIEADREAQERFDEGDFAGADRLTIAAITARARAEVRL